ncbi:hypothetical protein AVEN_245050-1 [Araneus ventricosus]|uniref:Uncharacterized protein n=1 Tax=Araneus ventricosus TaxID=182803 RepID=A0A4Y2E6L9_ARAVE|nr:hypothetical protein AVEN_245050-1 [Araneus ventricosus]
MPRRYRSILYDIVKGKKKRYKTTVDWSDTDVKAFQAYKNPIVQAALLAHKILKLNFRSLRLPGQFLQANSVKTEQSEFLDLLQQHFGNLLPVAVSSQSSARIFVHKELVNSSHVFVRQDAVRRPLQQPYGEPF